MPPNQADGMARTRALITPTERQHISGEGTDQQRYEAVSRVRRRVRDELSADVELLEEHHTELLEELREVVCVSQTPDDRAIDDIVTADECLSCGWSPASVILVDGDWQCYNCGNDPDERR